VSRIQLALNVTDLQAAVAFYTKLFDTRPAKLRAGYANFAVADPPLKLVLIEGHGSGGSLNHLGIEVATTGEVAQTHQRLSGQGLATATEDEVTCCYALQDKVWVDGPDEEPWEIYTVLADAEMPAGQLRAVAPGESVSGCCDSSSTAAASSCATNLSVRSAPQPSTT
jgi:catechol 2,3-dioxygenase-like lactoylglutathione lyase family enzyme